MFICCIKYVSLFLIKHFLTENIRFSTKLASFQLTDVIILDSNFNPSEFIFQISWGACPLDPLGCTKNVALPLHGSQNSIKCERCLAYNCLCGSSIQVVAEPIRQV